MREYGKDPDFLILMPGEAKRRNFHFTSAEDYPYKTICVDVAHKIEKNPAYAYFIVNKPGTHMAILMHNSKNLWIVEEKYDSRIKRTRRYYFAPVKCAKFVKI